MVECDITAIDQKARRLLCLLRRLPHPLPSDVSDEWLLQLVSSGGRHRSQLLAWCCSQLLEDGRSQQQDVSDVTVASLLRRVGVVPDMNTARLMVTAPLCVTATQQARADNTHLLAAWTLLLALTHTVCRTNTSSTDLSGDVRDAHDWNIEREQRLIMDMCGAERAGSDLLSSVVQFTHLEQQQQQRGIKHKASSSSSSQSPFLLIPADIQRDLQQARKCTPYHECCVEDNTSGRCRDANCASADVSTQNTQCLADSEALVSQCDDVCELLASLPAALEPVWLGVGGMSRPRAVTEHCHRLGRTVQHAADAVQRVQHTVDGMVALSQHCTATTDTRLTSTHLAQQQPLINHAKHWLQQLVD